MIKIPSQCNRHFYRRMIQKLTDILSNAPPSTNGKQAGKHYVGSTLTGFISGSFCYQKTVVKRNLELTFKTESCATKIS